ncbi:MAG TPA: ZIP family metal transporter [Bacillota bacterium]|nr:ZIP family metal transporter [Bacillota bacterium]
MLWLDAVPLPLTGIAASLLAGMATGIGALPVIFIRNVSQKVQDAMLGFGAGVMLAATSFSLIIPAMESAGGKADGAFIVAAGIVLGGLFLWAGDTYLPHEHFVKGREGLNVRQLKQIWLFIIAITLHNFPEGLAVGVGFGEGDTANGIILAAGIGLQNMPEGLVVALALLTVRYPVSKTLFTAFLTGLAEPVGGAAGVALVSVAGPFLPWALAFAAGAMLFVISDELIPESHRRGSEKEATFGVISGFILMMILDATLGGGH